MVSISVIIPVYNVEQYVLRCLESVMSQGDAGVEMECVVVDDCGSDGSMALVREAIASYDGPVRFSVVCHERNLGLSAARNTGLRRSQCDYVLFVDSDDYLLPGSIRCFADSLKMHPEADMVIGNARNKKDGSILTDNIREPWFIGDADVFFRRMLNHQIYLYAWNKLIRRSVLLDGGVFFIEGILFEDQSWSYLLFSRIGSVLLLPQVTYVYEYNPLSIVSQSYSAARAGEVVRSCVVSTNFLLDNPPSAGRYSKDMTVDYLLYISNSLMRGFDVAMRFGIPPAVAVELRAVRRRLMLRSLRYGRLLVACFMLLLWRPFSMVQRLSFFRHHYHDLERGVSVVAHLTDFLHGTRMRNEE